MQRVAVVGPGGAGKSTFARRLGERTGLPVVPLDERFWRPGWVETPRDEWRAVQEAALAGDAWIADGNYSGTVEVRFRRVDTIVLLDFPAWRCIPRVLRRRLRHRGQAVQAAGCPERFDWRFLGWIAGYRRRSRPRILAAAREHAPDATLHVLRSPRAVEQYLRSV